MKANGAIPDGKLSESGYLQSLHKTHQARPISPMGAHEPARRVFLDFDCLARYAVHGGDRGILLYMIQREKPRIRRVSRTHPSPCMEERRSAFFDIDVPPVHEVALLFHHQSGGVFRARDKFNQNALFFTEARVRPSAFAMVSMSTSASAKRRKRWTSSSVHR
jgi:hypothetical protein